MTGETDSPLPNAHPMMFGSAQRQLFGIMHPGRGDGDHRIAVLLCSPFGLEAIRSRRTFRVLAERLARAGHSVLRFDYFGTGDSAGEDQDVTLDGWGNDIEVASRTLMSEAPGLPIVWVGLGLGATAAWLTARRIQQPPRRLLLWEPVIDGPGYIETLRRRHQDLVGSIAKPSAVSRPTDAEGFEALGFMVSRTLANEMGALSVDTLSAAGVKIPTTLVSQPEDPFARLMAQLCQSVGPAFNHVEQSHSVDWMSETADAGTLVPGAAILKLAALIRSMP